MLRSIRPRVTLSEMRKQESDPLGGSLSFIHTIEMAEGIINFKVGGVIWEQIQEDLSKRSGIGMSSFSKIAPAKLIEGMMPNDTSVIEGELSLGVRYKLYDLQEESFFAFTNLGVLIVMKEGEKLGRALMVTTQPA